MVRRRTDPARVGEAIDWHQSPAYRMAMERMVTALGPKGQRAWDLLERVVKGTLTLGHLFDAYTHNDLEGLRARLQDADLGQHVASWQAWLVDRVSADTRAHYGAHLASLIVPGIVYPRSRFTGPEVARWLATRTALPQKRKRAAKGSRRAKDAPGRPISGATRRKYLGAAQSFATYLVEMGALTANPLRDVQAPPPSKPRVVEIALADVLRIVENAPAPYPALFALLYGAGVEVSAALACIESDVDTERREVRARARRPTPAIAWSGWPNGRAGPRGTGEATAWYRWWYLSGDP